MDFLLYRHWDWQKEFNHLGTSIYKKNIIDKLKKTGVKKILLASPEDYNPLEFFYRTSSFKVLKKYMLDNDIKFDIINCMSLLTYNNTNKVNIYDEYKDVIDKTDVWNTFFIHLTLYVLTLYKYNIPLYDNSKHTEYKFSCLNYKPHVHRKMLIDYFAKHNLIDDNLFSWHFEDDNSYKFKWWKCKKILVDDEVLNIFSPTDFKYKKYVFPKKSINTMFSVVPETDNRRFYLTEKTAKCYLLKHPFVTLGSVGFNTQLKNFGFELYDEVFDYSFDIEPDLEKRCEMLAAMVKNVEFDRKSFKEKIFKKIEHNYYNALDIALNNKYIPELLKEYLPHLPENDNLRIFTNLKNLDIVKEYIQINNNRTY